MENTKVFEMYPRSAALGLRFVRSIPGAEHDHEGFDERDVMYRLGPDRFDELMVRVASDSSVFVCGHDVYPEPMAVPDGVEARPQMPAGAEVHCLYAKDVERFLEEAPHA